MAIPTVVSSQTGAHRFNAPNFTKYSYFVGGVNATHHALENYSPLMNGFGRLFMVRTPKAIAKMFGGGAAQMYSARSSFMQFKHMLEYMNRSVTGFQDKTLEPAGTSIQGGFAGREFRTPTITKETTNQITIGLYELGGCPVFDVVDGWMNAIGDENSGLATYGGWISGGTGTDGKHKRLYKIDGETEDGIDFNEANHTCEFIYVVHDRSGAQVERAVMLADCYPTGIQQSPVLDMQAGQHDNVTYEVTFNCVVYRSPIITAIANDLLKQYRIVSNSLNFNPELGDAVYGDVGATKFQRSLGEIPIDSATGTNIGNVPVFNSRGNNATDTITGRVQINNTINGKNSRISPRKAYPVGGVPQTAGRPDFRWGSTAKAMPGGTVGDNLEKAAWKNFLGTAAYNTSNTNAAWGENNGTHEEPVLDENNNIQYDADGKILTKTVKNGEQLIW